MSAILGTRNRGRFGEHFFTELKDRVHWRFFCMQQVRSSFEDLPLPFYRESNALSIGVERRDTRKCVSEKQIYSTMLQIENLLFVVDKC